MDPKQITIAITVYNRRQYLKEAVASAVNQTVPVRVIVVEDCGPDAQLQSWIKDEFGSRIEYVRNPQRRGLFDNWNACMDLCGTEWLSILHDDDFLAPNFVESMLKLAALAPGLDLYFGDTVMVNERSEPIPDYPLRKVTGPWMRIGLTDVLFLTPFPFPGHIFPVAAVRALGGFRASSYYCGDWEMWANLIARRGAAQTADVVAYNRCHISWERGSTRIYREGKMTPASYAQHKRVLALMPRESRPAFSRVEYQRRFLIPVSFLLRYGAKLSPRLLHYHVRLLLLSPAPHWRYALFQQLTRLGGTPFVRAMSNIWRRTHSISD